MTEADEAQVGAAPEQLEGFDRVYPLIGGHHRYQWLLLAIVSFGGVNALNHMGYIFLGAVPDHWCKIDELSDTAWTSEQIKNLSIPTYTTLTGQTRFDQCSYFDLNFHSLRTASSFDEAYASVDFTRAEKAACSDWVYDKSIYRSTLVTEFNLVCGRKHLTAAIQGTYMAGVFVGSFVLGALSDRVLGRRGCILLASVLVMSQTFLAWLAPSYAIFILCRFILAIGSAGLFQSRLTILMEYCDASSRAAFSFMQWLPFCVVYMVLALYAYFLRDWRDLQLAFAVSTLVLISYFWILPESSRWLASNNRTEEAIKILEGIARTNKHPVPRREELGDILESCKDKSEKDDGVSASKSARAWTWLKRLCSNYVNLVRTPELRKRSLILWILFISVTLVYYGIAFDSPTLSSDPFLIVFIGGLVEGPGYIGAIPLAKWGRKPAAALTFLVAGFACAATGFVPNDLVWLRVTFAMIGKMFITASFSVVYLLATELYPTSERATGVAAAALMGRFGSIAAPFVALMKSFYADLPTMIYAIAGLLAGTVALLLPETKGTEMLDHIDKVEEVAARTRSASQNEDGVMDSIRNSVMQLRKGSGSIKLDEIGRGGQKTKSVNEDRQNAEPK